MPRFTGLLGLIVFLALAYAFSTNRRAIRWRTVVWGLGLQIFFAILVIKWTFGQTILHENRVDLHTFRLGIGIDESLDEAGLPGRIEIDFIGECRARRKTQCSSQHGNSCRVGKNLPGEKSHPAILAGTRLPCVRKIDV